MALKNFYLPEKNNIFLLLIDIQARLFQSMLPPIQDQMIQKIGLLLALAQKIGLPIIITEQYPKGLGETIPELKKVLDKYYAPITKLSFSCCREEGPFWEKVRETKKNQIILTGMETHVCVLQTALDFLQEGYQIFIPRDAVCSRKKGDWQIGLDLMKEAGAIITTTETIIFQLLERAGTEEFKFMSPLLKES
jgi:nicotinamidase-related amidase